MTHRANRLREAIVSVEDFGWDRETERRQVAAVFASGDPSKHAPARWRCSRLVPYTKQLLTITSENTGAQEWRSRDQKQTGKPGGQGKR
jgi:hypothetical protein